VPPSLAVGQGGREHADANLTRVAIAATAVEEVVVAAAAVTVVVAVLIDGLPLRDTGYP